MAWNSRVSLFISITCTIWIGTLQAAGPVRQGRSRAGSASLRGCVTLRGRPVAASEVRVVTPGGSIAATVATADDGCFSVGGLSPGSYFLVATSGDRMSPRYGVKLAHGGSARVQLEIGTAASKPGESAERLQRQIDRLRRQLAALQEQVEQLGAGEAAPHSQESPSGSDSAESGEVRSAAARPTGEKGREAKMVAGPEADPETAELDAAQQQAAGGLYGVPQKPSTEKREAEPPAVRLPGRGYTEKGLYGGLAAGSEGRRYARGLFGEAVKIGGYGSFRFEANNIPQGPQIGDLPPLKYSNNSFDFRRFVFTIDAVPSKRLRFYTEIEFERLSEIEIERNAIPENRGRANRNRRGTRFMQEFEGTSGGELAIEQAWAQFNITDSLGVRGGIVLPPVGRFNILHDDDYWDIPRRTLVDRGGPVLPAKVAWQELGAGLIFSKPLGAGYLDAQVYVVNGPKLDFSIEEVVAFREGRELLELEPEIAFSSGAVDGSQATAGLTWRAALSPRIGHEIALSGYHGRYTPDYLTRKPWVNTVAVDGKTTWGGFEIEGEFAYTKFNGFRPVLDDIALQLVDSAAKTFSSETSILESEVETGFAGPLTDSRKGFWIDFKYRLRPQWLQRVKELDDPHFIPILRWERIWFRDFVRGFEFSDSRITELQMEDLTQERFTLGLAFRLMPSVVVTAAWEHNRMLEGSRFIFPQPVGAGPIPNKTFDGFIVGTAFGF